jgi:hypothetical protein
VTDSMSQTAVYYVRPGHDLVPAGEWFLNPSPIGRGAGVRVGSCHALIRVRTLIRRFAPPSPEGRREEQDRVRATSAFGAAVALVMMLIPLAGVRAQDSFTGAWKIEKSEPAPWAKTADMLDAKEVKRLVGASVDFGAQAIGGPAPLACKGPHYEIKQYDADMLFQGALAEYGDPSTTPDKMADKIGFGKRPIASLVTGCASEIEFHALDADHVVFALNNSLFRMTRSAASAKATP